MLNQEHLRPTGWVQDRGGTHYPQHLYNGRLPCRCQCLAIPLQWHSQHDFAQVRENGQLQAAVPGNSSERP